MASKSNYPPVMKLWVSVLTLSIHDYTQGLMTGSYTSDYIQAREWIFAENQMPKNSFDNICLLCNLNPDNIRKLIKTNAEAILQRITNKVPKEDACTEILVLTEILD
jgi:hypothetical protein